MSLSRACSCSFVRRVLVFLFLFLEPQVRSIKYLCTRLPLLKQTKEAGHWVVRRYDACSKSEDEMGHYSQNFLIFVPPACCVMGHAFCWSSRYVQNCSSPLHSGCPPFRSSSPTQHILKFHTRSIYKWVCSLIRYLLTNAVTWLQVLVGPM